ncbi:phosphotransferase enzyme family protein [Lachnoclostridium phytofermentans]|uniref:phosphotransferase enzyme family protein n=1 Tax=Lachnoclostridium phytofermentans TaxID=66219 RepID=UPI000497D19F|nr:phosphotransferase [Lachnoclostridium phytofermentans]
MDSVFEVRYSQLSPDAIKNELLKRYEINECIQCEFYDSGMNDIYRIKTKNECYYLRISQTGMHNKRDYEEEISILQDLSYAGIPVVHPIKAKDDSFLWEINAPEGIRYGVLFSEAKNKPSKDKITCIKNLGRNIAKMHQRADEQHYICSRQPIDLKELIQKPLERIQPYLKNREEDYEFLCKSSEILGKRIEDKLPPIEPYYGFCHGDLHIGNIFCEGTTPVLFDFDCMGYGYRAYDLCVYAWNESYRDKKYLEGEEWRAMVEGYEEIRRLDCQEVQSIEMFIALRQLWLMGLHADVMQRNAGCCWYNDNYFNEQIKIYRNWLQKSNRKRRTIKK